MMSRWSLRKDSSFRDSRPWEYSAKVMLLKLGDPSRMGGAYFSVGSLDRYIHIFGKKVIHVFVPILRHF